MVGIFRAMFLAQMKSKISSLLELFSLFAHRHVSLGSYSKGMRQRILLIAALMDNPDVLILDEPLSGLDVTSVLIFKNLIQAFSALGKGVFYCSHILEVVEKVCSQLLILRSGHVIAYGSTEDVRRRIGQSSLERIFRELGADDLDLGMGVVLIFLAMPGVLVSLLMFEKYGSLIRFLRGDGTFDPFTATIPDEYFFIVLSMVVSCATALWRWNSIFLDRRDYVSLVPLAVSLAKIFLANLFAIFALAALLTVVVNAASFVLFPIAVVGSQGSFSKLFRFAFG